MIFKQIHPYFSFADDEKNAKKSLDDEVDHLHEPETRLIHNLTADDDGKEVDTELVTNVKFTTGTCGNKFSKDSKPRIYFFTEDSLSKHHGIASMAAAFQQCLKERQEEDVVILCNNLMEVILVQSALGSIKKESVLYVPYLKNIFPTPEEKNNLLDDLDSNSNLILLTDYRAFRGCEASHSIILTDLDKPIGANIMAEMLSRTMADLDFIALPKKNQTSYVNPIKTAFDTWQTRGWVQATTVKFHDEDESCITFKLEDSSTENPITIDVTIDIPDGDGFIPLQFNDVQLSKEADL